MDGKVAGGLRLRAVLNWIEPPIWRLLEVPPGLTLGDLHRVIQIAFGWEDSHLHAFSMARQTIRDERTRLDEVFRRRKSSLVYEYDFGDSWIHVITLEERLRENASPHVRCLDGARAAPPEDCGGVGGYENLLEVLADPDHEEHEDMVDWAEGYDPDDFVIEAVNRRLSRLRLGPRARAPRPPAG